MSIALRIVLFFASLLLTAFVFRNVKKAKMRIEDGMVWVLLAFLILLLSIFPGIASFFSDALGFQAPVNFVFLFFIFLLLLRNFATSRKVSQLENRLKELAQQVALNQLEHYERKGKVDKS